MTRKYLAVAVIVLCAMLSVVRLQVWRSDVHLWADARSKSPLKPRTALNYAVQHPLTRETVVNLRNLCAIRPTAESRLVMEFVEMFEMGGIQ